MIILIMMMYFSVSLSASIANIANRREMVNDDPAFPGFVRNVPLFTGAIVWISMIQNKNMKYIQHDENQTSNRENMEAFKNLPHFINRCE
jgi:hypothetical protein